MWTDQTRGQRSHKASKCRGSWNGSSPPVETHQLDKQAVYPWQWRTFLCSLAAACFWSYVSPLDPFLLLAFADWHGPGASFRTSKNRGMCESQNLLLHQTDLSPSGCSRCSIFLKFLGHFAWTTSPKIVMDNHLMTCLYFLKCSEASYLL